MKRTGVIGILFLLGTLFCVPAGPVAASGAATPAAPQRAQVRSRGHAPHRTGVTATGLTATITGQVLNGSTPVVGAQVEAQTLENCSFQSPSPTDAMGKFTLTGSACHYELWALGGGTDPITTTVVDATGGGTIAGQNVSVGLPNQQITGTVTAAGGGPVNGAGVTLALPSKLTNNPTLVGFVGTTTDANGAYALSAPAGVFTLAVSANTYENYTQISVAVPNTFSPVLTPYPVVISGTLLNGSTPLTNAFANISTLEPDCNFQAPNASDNLGNYVLYGEACHYELYLIQAFYNSSVTTVIDGSGGGTFTGQNVIAAPRTQHLTGTVVRTEGNPVNGASVSLQIASRLVPGRTLAATSDSTTGADGTFSLLGAPGAYTVTASADRYHPYTLRGVSIPGTLNPVLMPYPVAITGLTLSGGAPVTAGEIDVSTSEDSCGTRVFQKGATFTLFGDYCHYELWAAAGGAYMSTATTVVDATTGQTSFSGQNIAVAPTAQTLTGSVRSSAGGAAVFDASVSLQIPSRLVQGTTVLVASTQSAPDGSYSLNVAAGAYEVDVAASGFHAFTQTNVSAPGSLSPTLSPFAVKLTGQVGSGNRLLGGQEISIQAQSGTSCQSDNSLLSDAHGRFVLALDPGCKYEVWVRQFEGGFNSTITTLVSTPAGGSLSGPNLQVAPAIQSLHGTALIDRGATRAENANISVSLPSQLNPGQLLTINNQKAAADGTFAVPVATGSYHVDAEFPGTLTFSQSGVAVPGSFNPVLIASPCLPQPSIAQSVSSNGHGGLSVFVGASAPGVHLKALQFGPTSNGLIDVPGMAPGSTGNVTVPVAGSTSTSFTIRQQAPGGFTTVPFTVVYDCGSWPTFAGGGPAAFVGTTNPTTNVASPAPGPMPSGNHSRSNAPVVTHVDITSAAPSGGGAVSAPLPVPILIQQMSSPVVVDVTVPPVVDVSSPVVVDTTVPLVMDDSPAVVVDDSPPVMVEGAQPMDDVVAPIAADDGTTQNDADQTDDSRPPDS